jgi:hypothetical protein
MSVKQNTPTSPVRRPTRARRASTYFLLSVLALSAAGGGYLWLHSMRTRYVYEATADLPPYHQLVSTDFRRARVRLTDVPEHPVTDARQLVGRYTLALVGHGRPLNAKLLGPKLQVDALRGQLIVGLSLSTADLGGGTVAPGDQVDILLSSTASSGTQNGIIKRTLVLNVKADGKRPGQFVVDCAFPENAEDILLTAGGTARVFVVRSTPRSP